MDSGEERSTGAPVEIDLTIEGPSPMVAFVAQVYPEGSSLTCEITFDGERVIVQEVDVQYGVAVSIA